MKFNSAQIIEELMKNMGKIGFPNFSTTRPTAVFVLGGPGCGKGTQCAKI